MTTVIKEKAEKYISIVMDKTFSDGAKVWLYLIYTLARVMVAITLILTLGVQGLNLAINLLW
jgi:hypothetical protein